MCPKRTTCLRDQQLLRCHARKETVVARSCIKKENFHGLLLSDNINIQTKHPDSNLSELFFKK